MFQIQELPFQRCLKPNSATGNPSLIIFSDGSDEVFESCAYIRWELQNRSFCSRLILSKNCVTPLRKMTPVRSELCGTVLSARIRKFINKECRFSFQNEYFIVDSEIVKAMIQKEAYGFNSFAVVRIGEIQEETDKANWYWIPGKLNIADWITPGQKAVAFKQDSTWQNGPDFLKLPEDEWPVQQESLAVEVPEQFKSVLAITQESEENLAKRINISRFSSYQTLLRVTARVSAI